MALQDEQFKDAIKSIMDEMVQAEDYEASKELYATLLVAAVKAYLVSGQVTITGTSNQGAFTGTGTIS